MGLIFGPIAAAMAFLVTYEEYTHHYPGKAKPLRFAVEAAIFTFIVFGFLSLLISFFVAGL